jgi:hypothetical protein
MTALTSIKTTQFYAKVIEQRVSVDMQDLRKRLNRNNCKDFNYNLHVENY